METITLLCTDGSDVAVEALRRGAYDYFAKPFSFDAMTFTVKRLIERRRLRREARCSHQQLRRLRRGPGRGRRSCGN